MIMIIIIPNNDTTTTPNTNNNNNNNKNNQKHILYQTLLKLKIKYKFSITIVKKDFWVVWCFQQSKCKQLSIN